ncbi:hypothetical protein [Mycoplasma sp. 3686d]|uniref:hypothetical protein n=1 Tax=Mycoplasma sp. 3686d TaxID=2967300 RepID=UPI00211C19FA|nr:hypothetical protein [Mycoplasma sp. 3686d]UUM24695.1 hypothetical protein NPA12_03290 [Mycoplasma sp. 3686d]
MSLKNKLIIGASATSLIPLATMSCSNERSASENKAIVDAAASLVQVSVYDKESDKDNAKVKTNIYNVYSTYVKSDRDVIFHGFNPKKYQVVDTSYQNFNGYTVVKFKLKDIKTSTLSEEKTYTIKGFKLNPEYTLPLSSTQEANADLFKSEMRLEANTDIDAQVKMFAALEKYIPNFSGYTSDQFNQDLKKLEEYLKFLQDRFAQENYSTDFEVNSIGQYLDHKVDSFDSLYPQYKEALNRLLSLKAIAFLNDNSQNGLSDKEFNTYVEDFKKKVEDIKNNPYWSRNPELPNKYNSDLEAILDEINTLLSKDPAQKEKLQKILEQFGQSDLSPEDQIKYAVLQILNPKDGASKLLQTIQGELDKLREADQKIPATQEQKDQSDRFKGLILASQDQITKALTELEPLKSEDEFAFLSAISGWDNPDDPDYEAPKNFADANQRIKDSFETNFKLKTNTNSWYSEDQFNKDLVTLEKMLTFLQEQKVTEKDSPATKHWDFNINNLYDVKKYNLDKFLELEPEYTQAITRLSTMSTNVDKNLTGRDLSGYYQVQNLKSKQTDILKKLDELRQKPEFRGLPKLILKAFGDDHAKIRDFAEGLWDEELGTFGLNKKGTLKEWDSKLATLLKLIIPGLNNGVNEQNQADKDKIVKDFRINSSHVTNAVEYVAATYIDQLGQAFAHVDELIDEFEDENLTPEQTQDAKDMQKWIRYAQVYIPALRNLTKPPVPTKPEKPSTPGGDVDKEYKESLKKHEQDVKNYFAKANKLEKEYWQGLDKSKDPLYKDKQGEELFNSDLEYYTKFMEFLQDKNPVSGFETKALDGNEDISSISDQKTYYKANIDLFKLRSTKFKEVFGRLRGLAAYNWIATVRPERVLKDPSKPQGQDNPLVIKKDANGKDILIAHANLITPEALEKLYNENKEKAYDLFFVDMTQDNASKSSAKPTENPARDNYDANFDFVKKSFKDYNDLGMEKSDNKTAILDEENYTFADADASLRDRYLQYRKLTALKARLDLLEEAYSKTAVSNAQNDQIENLKLYLKGFKPADKERFLNDIKNKVYTLLSRSEGKKAGYSVDKFLGENFNPEMGDKYQGDLRDVANFLDYLETSKALDTKLVHSTHKIQSQKDKAFDAYTLKQYADYHIAKYADLEAKFVKAMTTINSYVVESFLEKENIDPNFQTTNQTTQVKSLIEKYTKEYDELLKKHPDIKTNDVFKADIAVLDPLKTLLEEIKEETNSAEKFTKLQKDYFISLPTNSIDNKNYIRVEELSKFILYFSSFKFHVNEFTSQTLGPSQKDDLNAKEKELNDNNYLVTDADKAGAELLAINKEFLHPDHEADTTKHLDKHSYSEADLVKDVNLVVSFYKEAAKLKALIEGTRSQNSSRLFRKTLELYNAGYNLAKAAYKLALERIYNNKVDLYKLKAIEIKEITAVNKFDDNVQDNNKNARTLYTTAIATQKDLLTLFALKEDNSADTAITQTDKESTTKTVLGSDAKSETTPGANASNITNAINKQLKLFIFNISQTKANIDSNTNKPTN